MLMKITDNLIRKLDYKHNFVTAKQASDGKTMYVFYKCVYALHASEQASRSHSKRYKWYQVQMLQ